MNKRYIARMMCGIASRFTIWLLQVLICIAVIGTTFLITAEYNRTHAIEVHRVRQRKINSFVRTGYHTAHAIDAADVQLTSLTYTAAYITDLVQLNAVSDCGDLSSTCQRAVMHTLATWIEYQSTIAWLLCCTLCVVYLMRRCPVSGIIECVSSEMAVHRFKSQIITQEKAVADAFDHTDRIAQGGREMNSNSQSIH